MRKRSTSRSSRARPRSSPRRSPSPPRSPRASRTRTSPTTTSSPLSVHDLGRPGIAYVRDALESARTLGKLIAASRDLIADPFARSHHTFGEGGILAMDESLEWAGGVFEEVARSVPSRVVIGIESLAEWSDTFLDRTGHKRSRNRAWFFGDEIYWRHLPGEDDDWSIADVLAGTRGYALNAVSIVTQPPARVEGDLELQDLEFSAERTRLVAVVAGSNTVRYG